MDSDLLQCTVQPYGNAGYFTLNSEQGVGLGI